MKRRPEELTAAYFSGTLQGQEFEELKIYLRKDRQFLKRFCDEADFEQELREVAMAMPFAPRAAKKRLGRGTSWAVAALLFLASGWGFFEFWRGREPEILADFTVSLNGRVLLSGPSEGRRESGQLEKGATLRVAQGTVEIVFREGVRCLLDAPGELSVVKQGRVILQGGRARFDVEEQARGFQVISGDLQLTDLGTTFGVDATRATPEVHVLSGLVIGQGRSGKREEIRVEGGQAMVLASEGALTPIPIDEERFPDALGTGIPALLLSFDGNGEGCAGSIARRDGVNLSLANEYAPEVVAGRFGEALRFDGRQTHALTNWPGISGSQARSVSLWLKAEKSELANPILGWGALGTDERMSFFGLRLSFDGTLRIVSGRRWLEGSTVIDDGEWHHVVVVTGDYKKGAWPVTKLYINGQAEGLTPRVPLDGKMASLDTFETLISEPDSEPLMIGRFAHDSRDMSWTLPSFAGLIDEVIVAEGIINDQEVRALYEGRLDQSGLDL